MSDDRLSPRDEWERDEMEASRRHLMELVHDAIVDEHMDRMIERLQDGGEAALEAFTVAEIRAAAVWAPHDEDLDHWPEALIDEYRHQNVRVLLEAYAATLRATFGFRAMPDSVNVS